MAFIAGMYMLLIGAKRTLESDTMPDVLWNLAIAFTGVAMLAIIGR